MFNVSGGETAGLTGCKPVEWRHCESRQFYSRRSVYLFIYLFKEVFPLLVRLESSVPLFPLANVRAKNRRRKVPQVPPL